MNRINRKGLVVLILPRFSLFRTPSSTMSLRLVGGAGRQLAATALSSRSILRSLSAYPRRIHSSSSSKGETRNNTSETYSNQLRYFPSLRFSFLRAYLPKSCDSQARRSHRGPSHLRNLPYAMSPQVYPTVLSLQGRTHALRFPERSCSRSDLLEGSLSMPV